MSSSFGKNIKISIFGQSHSTGIGVTVDGLPYGFEPDMEALSEFMARRAPGKNKLSTKRKEGDEFEVLSGMADGKFCGAPFCAVIRNSDTRPGDYSNLRDVPRPGHADFTANVKYGGNQDVAGGGHFSGRLTAPMCIAGGILKQVLESEGIYIGAHIKSVKDVEDLSFDPVNVSPSDFKEVLKNEIPVISSSQGDKMKEVIISASQMGDSVGGVIECAVVGLPVGVGDPMYDGMENKIASSVFAVPAIKGIEFGIGFEASKLYGSENNDSFRVKDGKVVTETNNHGGILGGISSGMPIIFRAAVKPTPSIFKEQKSVSLSKMEDTALQIKGRHDPCIVQRAVPCIEAAAAIAVYDALLDYKKEL